MKPRPRLTRRSPGCAQSTRRSRVIVVRRSRAALDAHRPLLGAEPAGVGADVKRHGVCLGVLARPFVLLDQPTDALLTVDWVGVVGALTVIGCRAGPRSHVRLLARQAQVEWLAFLLLDRGGAEVVDGNRIVARHHEVVLRVAGDPLAGKAGLGRGAA